MDTHQFCPTLPGHTLDYTQRAIALAKLGYLSEVDPGRYPFDDVDKCLLNLVPDDLDKAVGSYQEFHGLTADTWWGPKTRAMYDARYCAVPDKLPIGEGLPRWSILNPTVSNLTQNASYQQQFRRAVENWAALPSKFSPQWVGRKDRANIWGTFRRIDGQSNVLAWSMLPTSRGQGEPRTSRLEQRYDSAERWEAALWDFLGKVIEHELGHAFGHPHYQNRRDRMFPSWSPNMPELEESPVTVPETIKRYGQGPGEPGDPGDPEDPKEDWEKSGLQVRVGGKLYDVGTKPV